MKVLEIARRVRTRSAAVRFDGRKNRKRHGNNVLGVETSNYADLSRTSSLIGQVRFDSQSPSLNLLVPSAIEQTAFAGVRTAISFSETLADVLELRLQVGTTSVRGGKSKTLPNGFVSEDRVGDVPLTRLGDGESLVASGSDIWVVTHWSTAHVLDIAVRLGVVNPRNVVYLVQDYEPNFLPWSTDFALARATYHAGFTTVCNSRPLAEHLRAAEEVDVADDLVLAPHIPNDRLRLVSETRNPDGRLGVLFYARPSKPRNLYTLGVSTLKLAAERLGSDARECDFFSAGEPHKSFGLGDGRSIKSLGQTGWDGYFDLLARTRVGLSLMYSPHPSHPPLELAVSGALAVTNRFDGARENLHPNIVCFDEDPDLLADGLVAAIRSELSGSPGSYSPLPPDALGYPLDQVATSLANRISTDTSTAKSVLE